MLNVHVGSFSFFFFLIKMGLYSTWEGRIVIMRLILYHDCFVGCYCYIFWYPAKVF